MKKHEFIRNNKKVIRDMSYNSISVNNSLNKLEAFDLFNKLSPNNERVMNSYAIVAKKLLGNEKRANVVRGWIADMRKDLI